MLCFAWVYPSYNMIQSTPPPYRKISATDVRKAMEFLLQTPSTPLNKLTLDGISKRKAVDAAEYYHQQARWYCSRYGWRSRIEIWTDPRMRSYFSECKTEYQKRSALSVRAYSATHWNPAIAACLYRAVGAKSVLDPCAGWGDRLAAALALPEIRTYHGFDPNKQTTNGYAKQIQEWGTERDFSVQRRAFEDVSLQNNFYDVVLTSPPYWRLESYSLDPEQSALRYSSYEQWKQGFLSPLINKSHSALKKGGHFFLNVSDPNINGVVYPLEQDAQEVAANAGFVFMECKRYPLGDSTDRTEPLFIWRKK